MALAADALVFTTDGDPIPGDNEADLFTYGTAVPHADAGMAGPNVRAIARAHGWAAAADAEYRDGIRIRISGVERIDERG